MTSDQFAALIAYIDQKAAEAEHAAMHGGSVSTQGSELALEMLKYSGIIDGTES